MGMEKDISFAEPSCTWGLGKIRVFLLRGNCDWGSMNGVYSQPSRLPHGSDSWRRRSVAGLYTVTRESQNAPSRFFFKVCVGGGGSRTWQGRGLRGAGRVGKVQVSRTPIGVASRGLSREAPPARPDGLGAVAGSFPGSRGMKFSFP